VNSSASGKYTAIFSLLLLAGLGHSALATELTVKAPCTVTGEAGVAPCADYLQGTTTRTGLIKLVEKQVRLAIDGDSTANPPVKGYYQKVDPSSPIGAGFGPTICDPVGGGPFIKDAEIGPTNHLGDSCGTTMHIDVKTSFSNHNIRGCARRSSVFKHEVTFDKSWKPELAPEAQPGTFEDGLIRGALIQAMSCHFASVKNELSSKRSLTLLSVGSDQPSQCLAIAQDVKTLTERTDKSLEILRQRLAGEPNAKELLSCDANANKDVAAVAASSKLSGRQLIPDNIKQSAEQLCAARAAIEGMFAQLSACEVFSRAQNGYLKKLGTLEAKQAFYETLTKFVQEEVSNRCEERFSNRGRCDTPNSKEVTQCVNELYKDQVRGMLQKLIEEAWPSNGSCQASSRDSGTTSPLSGFFFIGALGSLGALGSGAGFRRRKRLSRVSPLKALPMALLAVIAAASGGCKHHASKIVIPQPPNPITEPECLPPTGPNCTSDHPGSGPINLSISGAATAGSTADAALNEAERLIGPALASDTAGKYAQGEAASAGTSDATPVLGKNGGNAGGGAGSASGLLTTPSGGSTRGGKSGGGGGAGGSGSGGGLKTAASSDLSNTQQSAATDGSGSSYRGGESGAGSGSASGGAGSAYGSGSGLSGDGSESGTSTALFGKDGDAGARALDPSGSTDPEDYFTRLGLGDSLFKTVEKRYRQKASQWAIQRVKP
jgi:hypothetical protein